VFRLLPNTPSPRGDNSSRVLSDRLRPQSAKSSGRSHIIILCRYAIHCCVYVYSVRRNNARFYRLRLAVTLLYLTATSIFTYRIYGICAAAAAAAPLMNNTDPRGDTHILPIPYALKITETYCCKK
jgi:hypothetical protein